MRMTRFFKIIQKRTYDILSNGWTLFCFIAFLIVLPTTIIIMFEKILWIWNGNQSLMLFKTDYVGQMVDKSLNSIGLCESKPSIDVVYTWVNGSEGKFLNNLLKVKHNYLTMIQGEEINCSIPLTCTTRNGSSPQKDHSSNNNRLIFMDTTLVAIDSSIDIQSIKMLNSKPLELITTQSFDNQYHLLYLKQDERKALVDYFKFHSNSNLVKPVYVHIDCSNFTLTGEKINLAESFVYENIIYLSSTSPFGSVLTSEVILSLSSSSSASLSPSIVPLSLSTFGWLPPRKQFLKLFTEKEKVSIRNIVFHPSRRAALILLEPFSRLRDHDSFLDHLLSLGQRYNFSVTQSPSLYLGDEDLIECSNDEISEPLTINRFADNDELRYSLRSVEKFAPWVRNIYIVTNGQVPRWLNLDNPKLRLITHEDIFPEKSDLPTFNSAAIEIHLHRIPGLSEKFLYFNDDIMLGKPVYLEDFYSPVSGYKIYQAWPVPNCDPGCPVSWLGDGFCDQACNTTLCLFDGGDCKNKTSSIGGISSEQRNYRGAPAFFTASRPITDQCRPSCANFWLGDKYCDNVCNHPDCAFDMGDCGLDGYSTIPGHSWSPSQKSYFYPSPTPSIYLNLTDLMSVPNFSLTSASYSAHLLIRSVTLHLKHQLLTILFSANVTEILIPIELRYKIDGESHKLDLQLNVTSSLSETFELRSESITPMTTESVIKKHEERLFIENNSISQADPIIIFNLTSSTDHNESLIDCVKIISLETQNSSVHISQTDEGDIIKLINTITLGQYEERPLGIYPWENEVTFKKLAHLIANYEKYGTISNRSQAITTKATQRQLFDIFLESIKYVNYLYNRIFGIKARKIVAHSPILLDRSIIGRLWETFPDELAATSSHKLRSSNDMQFSFSYFNFLMSETLPTNYKQVIEKFDTDHSNSLSANELRSLLVNIVDPSIVPIAWSNYSDCWNGSDYDSLKQKSYEWTFDALLECPRILDSLDKKFTSKSKNLYTLMSDSDVSFTMIRPNPGQLINKLDGLRRDPKKFLCFNDDLQNDGTDEVNFIRSSLKEYYQYLVPKASSFELPNNRINQFTDISSYRSWKQSQQLKIMNSIDQPFNWFYFTLYGVILFWLIFKTVMYFLSGSRGDLVKTIKV